MSIMLNVFVAGHSVSRNGTDATHLLASFTASFTAFVVYYVAGAFIQMKLNIAYTCTENDLVPA